MSLDEPFDGDIRAAVKLWLEDIEVVTCGF
jgi:hypothetical protein